MQNLEADIEQYEPIFNKIFDIGEKAVKETSGAEAKEIEDELTDIKTVWYQLNTLLQDRRNKITSVEPLATKYQQALQSLAVTMAITDKALDGLEVIGAEPEEVREQLETLQVSLLTKRVYQTLLYVTIPYLMGVLIKHVYFIIMSLRKYFCFRQGVEKGCPRSRNSI